MLAAAAALLALAPAAYVRTRCAALVVSSVVVLAAAIGIGPAYACVLFLCVAWVAIAARLAASRGRAGSLVVLLGPVAIAWVFSKSVSAFQPGWLQFAGFSYFFIKAWTLLKDLQDGRVERPDPWEVAAYFLYFPTFVSGPMHLYAEFRETLRNPSFPGREGFVDVVLRVLLGFVKIKVIGPLLAPISLVAVSEGGTLSFTTLAVGSFAYSVVIWANFSGYTDLAV
ncbi:MAG TPA: hypothetical protein VD867_12530, partial [Burkholderiales bacterium]|nr:hypothetical protein [Burkholderiales bacterium]